MKPITFTKVDLPYGWLGNMSPHPVKYDDKWWKTTEALFQALRFEDEGIREAIRAAQSPMTAKMISKARKNRHLRLVEPESPADLDNLRLVLRLQLQHERLSSRATVTRS